MIAALYVARGGVYFGVPGVDPWDESRDARNYVGPWPVVAHPPCARWERYWTGGPSARERRRMGDDGGCFVAALAAVRRWGGVLEHPADSHAWRYFGLIAPPRGGGWVVADWLGGWTCCVEQGHYGHPARKATWLYANGTAIPLLRWGDCGIRPPAHIATRTGICQRLSHRQRETTPPAFRDLLITIARSALSREAAA